MRFLAPVGGEVDAYGILTSYAHKGIPAGIVAGLPWAGDNCAFTGTDAARFLRWLATMRPYRAACLFVAVPDVVGNAAATLAQYAAWSAQMDGWPLAFVCQDGQQPDTIPACAALFIGGTTDWKESQAAVDCIREGQRRGLHVHIGRTNWGRRYRMFRVLAGSEHFTCDGTRTRYEGVERTLRAWRNYEAQAPLIQLLQLG